MKKTLLVVVGFIAVALLFTGCAVAYAGPDVSEGCVTSSTYEVCSRPPTYEPADVACSVEVFTDESTTYTIQGTEHTGYSMIPWLLIEGDETTVDFANEGVFVQRPDGCTEATNSTYLPTIINQ